MKVSNPTSSLLILLYLFVHVPPGKSLQSRFQLRQDILDHIDKTSPSYIPRLRPLSTTPAPPVDHLTLKLIIGFFRHGNRSPRETYKGDPYPFNDTRFWPEGPSQLTKVGKKELYNLGKKLKYRYEMFLGDYYSPDEVKVKSNPVERDMMSAACLLAALYPPKGKQIWIPELQWQPIPIWGQPYDATKVTTVPTVCPAYHSDMMRARSELNTYSGQYKYFLDFLRNMTSINASVISDTYKHWDIFTMERDAGYELPLWLSEDVLEELNNVYAADMATTTSATLNMTRLISGPIISEILEELQAKVNNTSKKKIHLEAVHETTLNALLPAFGFNELFLASSGATYLIELHQIKNQYFVQFIYYNNTTVETPNILLLNKNVHLYPLNNVVKTLTPLIPKNWNLECQRK